LTAGGVTLALGGWLFASPWMFGYGSMGADALNSVMLGAFVFTTGIAGFGSWVGPGLGLVAVKFLLGLWAIASPWAFGYGGGEAAMWNCIVVGIVIVTMALYRARGILVGYR